MIAPALDYERAQARGRLSDEELEAVIELYAHSPGLPSEVAKALDLPADLVLKAFEDPAVLDRAVVAKRGALRVTVWTLVVNTLTGIVSDTEEAAKDRITAATRLIELSGDRKPVIREAATMTPEDVARELNQ